MNKITTFLTIIFLATSTLFSQVIDSIDMTAGNTLDIFYSMETGSKPAVAGAEWTIAFSTGSQTASIYINDGRGVELYNTNTAISNFSSFSASDTNGLASSWTKIHNSFEDWKHSAYENEATGHPNYGWGDYNTVSHIVVGSKVFVLKTQSGEYFKTAVVKRENGKWYFKYANLNGGAEETLENQATDLQNSNFSYFNFDNELVSNREPSNDEWDILFTKYYSSVKNDVVIGVLANSKTEIIQIDGVSNTSANYDNGTFSETANEIGYDWYNQSTNSIIADRTYFVKQRDGDIYKIFFTRHDGSSTGKTVFSKEKLFEAATAINNEKELQAISIFPNPVKNIANILLDSKKKTTAIIKLYNVIGKEVYQESFSLNSGLNNTSINVEELNKGIYIVKIENGNEIQTLKMKVSH